MSDQATTKSGAGREYARLLRLHERLLGQLERVRAELTSVATAALVKEIEHRTGAAPSMADVVTAVEESIRAVQLAASDARKAVAEPRHDVEIEGVPNLPAHLRRFLADRAPLPGFSYEVGQDEVRGWVIRWKEYTPKGTVRGFGQFYERPHAWLED